MSGEELRLNMRINSLENKVARLENRLEIHAQMVENLLKTVPELKLKKPVKPGRM